ncbi:37S ribosomal protein S22 [Coemansia sp. RSA 552]|nr:37S ribosomal protein S22 [Coemansia sp. RSA 552]
MQALYRAAAVRPASLPTLRMALRRISGSQRLCEDYNTGEPDPDRFRCTPAAIFGRKYMGMVVVPDHIAEAVSTLVEPLSKPDLRHDYLRLADALRSTGQVTPYGKGRGNRARKERHRIRELRENPMLPEIEEMERNSRAPRQLQGERIELVVPGVRPAPESLVNPGVRLKPHSVEYGPGEAAAYLAALAPGAYAVAFNVLSELAARLPGFRPQSILDFGAGPATVLWAAQEVWDAGISRYVGIDSAEAMVDSARTMIAALPERARPQKIELLRYLAPEQPNTRADLVVSAFALSELPSDDARNVIVETLWNNTDDTLVLIDRGTPAASLMISAARTQLLELGAQAADPATLPSGIHTVAPNPNDLPDPTDHTPTWMHFSQRVQRPRFTMRTKHSKSNLEDAHYSYVVMRRGPRPSRPKPDAGDTTLPAMAYYWPRILMPPIKRKGHVVTDVCTTNGNIERWTFTRTHDRQAYRDARKACWGDLFPHQPKSSQVRAFFEPLTEPTPEEIKKFTRKQRRSMRDFDDE